MPAKRPELIAYSGVKELYEAFERLFLRGGNASAEHESSCGCTVKIFDHHFFHMVKLCDPQKPQPLVMAIEKEIIRNTHQGFANYTHDRQRGIHLASAALAMVAPDEVWMSPALHTEDVAFIKLFDTTPYNCTIFLAKFGDNEGEVLPVTSYRGRSRDIRKYCRGTKIYP